MNRTDFLNQHNWGVLYACISGGTILIPIDPTTKYSSYMPYYKQVGKLQDTTQGREYDTKKPTSIQIHQAKGYQIDTVYIQDSFPDIYAENKNDKFCFCDFPALAQFRSAEVKCNNYKIESIPYEVMIERVQKKYRENFKYIAQEWLGGCNVDAPTYLQEFSGYKGAYWNENNGAKNLLKKKYDWRVPLLASFFCNEEKFKFGLALNSLIEFTFSFNSFKNIINRTENFNPPEISGELNVYITWLTPNEDYLYLNLPYVSSIYNKRIEKDNRYFFGDHCFEFNLKKYQYNTDFKLNIKAAPTTDLYIWIKDSIFTSGYKFFGYTTQKAAENFILCHIVPNTKNTSLDGTIKLSTGKFPNDTSRSGPWSIEEWEIGKKNFFLKYNQNATVSYLIEIKSRYLPFSDLGDLWFDLNCFILDTKPAQFRMYYFSEFTLDIMLYDTKPTSKILYEEQEDLTITIQNGTKLCNGLFTYCPNVANQNVKYAFWSISDIKKSLFIDELFYKYSLSLPVPTVSNNANLIAQKDFVLLYHQIWSWYDLDRTFRQRLEEVKWEKNNGMSDTFEKTHIELYKDFFYPDYHLIPDFSYNVQYTDPRRNIETKGYLNLINVDYVWAIPKLIEEELIFDNLVVTTIYKDKSHQSSLNFAHILILQNVFRTFYYSDDLTIQILTDHQRDELEQRVIDELKRAGLYAEPPKRSVEDNYNFNNLKRFRPDDYSANNNAIMFSTFNQNKEWGTNFIV